MNASNWLRVQPGVFVMPFVLVVVFLFGFLFYFSSPVLLVDFNEDFDDR